MKRTILILSLAAFVCACSSRSAGRLSGTYPGAKKDTFGFRLAL